MELFLLKNLVDSVDNLSKSENVVIIGQLKNMIGYLLIIMIELINVIIFVLLEEMGVSRESAGSLDTGTNFAEILSNALPPHALDKNKEKSSDSSVSSNLSFSRKIKN